MFFRLSEVRIGMSTTNRNLLSRLTVGLLAAGLFAAAGFAAETRTVSIKVGTALTAAKEAAGKKQFDVAMAKIKEAEAAEKKTAYDQFQINELQAYILVSQRKYAETAALYEKSLDSQFLSPDQAEQRVKQVAELYFASQQTPKAIEYSKRWLKSHPNDGAMYGKIADAYFRSGDFKQSKEAANTAIAIAEKEGKEPEESWLLFAQNTSAKLDDSKGKVAALEKLVRYHPKPEYWAQLLDLASRNEKSDQVQAEIFRLQRDVGALKTVDDYSAYAQMTMDAAPEEALRVVQAGFDKKVLGNDGRDKERHQRLLNGVKQKAEANRPRLAQLEKDAQSATATAQTSADLGMEYFSYEMYDKAIPALEKALKSKDLKNADEARIALGISYLRKNQKEQARAQFKAVPNTSAMAKVGDLWTLRTYN
jgi:tetratricopeptide (TPR) repeat protein